MIDNGKRLDPTPRMFEMHHDSVAAQESGAVSVEYGLLIALFGAAVLGVLLSLGDQLVDVFGIIVDAAIEPRNPTTVVGMAWTW